jgi:acyl-CoA synthetase (AMP-forming)/AMP-acid ligase II
MDKLHGLTLGDVLREHRRSRPERDATVDGDIRLSFPELDDRVNQAANALASDGVGPGDRVLWVGQNSFRVLELWLATAKLGAMFCPANWRQSPEEIAFVIDDFDAKVVFWQEEEVGDTVRAGRDLASSSVRWIRHDDDGPDGYEAMVAAASTGDPDVDVESTSSSLVIYTAAFAGRPNGAMLSHTACITQGLVHGSMTGTSGDSVYLNSGPMFHLGTLMYTLATFVYGGTNVFLRRVEADDLCRVIAEERCTGAFLVGPMMDMIVETNADGRYDLTCLRLPPGRRSIDAMVSPDDSPWAAWPGGYGQTEAVGMMTFNCLGLGAIGTHGRPSPVIQIRIVDEDDNDVPVGEVGEFAARGPTVMNGYWNRPEENAHRSRNGWHHTNDLGRREVDGSLTFIGPKTRMLKSAAENIYPAEVERCIAAHPGVAECAVIGIPDPKWVQSVKAIVVVKDGATIDIDDLIEHCRTRMASYKKPRTVEFVDALPRNGFVVDYDALDASFGGGNYPGGRTRSA